MLPLTIPPIPKKGVEKLLQSFPTLTKHKVFHVGDLENPRQINGDFEGPLLSVSSHPDAWRKIARLGNSPTWRIVGVRPHSKKSAKTDTRLCFLDARTLKKKPDSHLQWAASLGLVTPAIRWAAEIPIGEDDEMGISLHPTLEEATIEHHGHLPPKETNVWDSGQELTAFWNQRKPENTPLNPGLTETAVLALLIELGAAINPELPDGIWWTDILNPCNYSAPRGGISPSKPHKTLFQN